MIEGLIPILLFLSIVGFSGFHKIDEGNVGVYYKFGALQNTTSSPGFNFMLPFITSMQNI